MNRLNDSINYWSIIDGRVILMALFTWAVIRWAWKGVDTDE
jgi:hypothetical protein